MTLSFSDTVQNLNNFDTSSNEKYTSKFSQFVFTMMKVFCTNFRVLVVAQRMLKT